MMKIVRGITLSVVAWTLASCSAGSKARTPRAEKPLLVSTHMGLRPMTPGVSDSMTANLRELVYPPAAELITSLKVEGSTVVLTLVADASLPANQLAALLRADGLIAAEARDERTVVARF